ncbi:unnamed protein product [Mytilus edulis]|uniref:Reverse transcriptase domain-containing protein n=1 Tax=Mytilus edulis TaxID=6550 RepID=A0A8S3RSB7_MYTED|nr:unnamed protein product [Mytilus edulis]
MVKSLFGRQHKEIPLLKVNDELIDDREKMADIFNVYFSDQSNIDDSNVQLPNLEKFTSELTTIEITEKDVEDILLNLDTSKAIGPDCVSPRLLKEAIKSWNSQTNELQNSPSLLAFKNNFRSNREIKPVFYYCGSRSGQIYHARIRMNCSGLNKHLYDRNLIQSPKCVCGDPETTDHYLLKCKIFNVPRQRHIHNLQIPIKISTNVLLFGSDRLTVEQNILIFKAVQNFIISSNRFTSTIK